MLLYFLSLLVLCLLDVRYAIGSEMWADKEYSQYWETRIARSRV